MYVLQLMVKNLELMHKSSKHRWFVPALWSNGSYHWAGTNLASLLLSEWLQVNFNLFFYYIQDFGWFNRQLLWRLLCRENGWSTGLSLHSSSHWINEPALCQLPCSLGMVDKVLQLSLELWNCWMITLLCELSVNLCQQVDQLVFEQLVHERFPRLCESFLFCWRNLWYMLWSLL